MIDPTAKLSVSRQATVLGISRGSIYYQKRPVSDADLKLMHRIDKLHIVYGRPQIEGTVVLPPGEETVTPLCLPKFASLIRRPEDPFNHALIDSDNKLVRWPDWFAANGLSPPPTRGTRFDRSFLAISAAAHGLGVALESTRLAESEIASGRLVPILSGQSVDVRYVGHHLVFPQTSVMKQTLRTFTNWLLLELGVGSFDLR